MKNKKQSVGEFGEQMAAEYLIRQGYRILERNIQRSYMEIDILAKKDNLYVFVEVRTRTSMAYGGAENALGSRKIKNFRFGVKSFARKKNLDFNFLRLDFIAVDINKAKKTVKIKHFRDIA